MKSILVCLVSVALASSASAQFSVSSGAGAIIPATGSGDSAGWDPANLDNDLTLAVAPGTASVFVPVPVTNIDSIVLEDLTHTFAGDTLAVLRDPYDVGYVVWLRPGLSQGSGCCGTNRDLGPGTYTFLAPGTPGSSGALPITGDILPGFYDQSFNSGALVPAVWPNGDEMIFNRPFSLITGPAGVWTIEIYDFATGDMGSFSNFILTGNNGGGGGGMATFCDPGTNNSTGFPAVLTGSFGSGVGCGLHLEMTGGVPSQLAYMLCGNQPTSGFPLGDGRLCLVGDPGAYFYRFNLAGTPLSSIGGFNGSGVWVNASGTSTTGFGFDVPSTIPATVPIAIMSGDVWHFQGWFRDTPAGVGHSNFSNGLSVMIP